jgi:glutamate synthase domain-containing protein 2
MESGTDGKPLNRNQRAYIYSRAKKQNAMHPFGTELDLQKDNETWVRHSIYPTKLNEEQPRVIIGGKDCKQPYSASLLNISAMSYGSLSKNAVSALNIGAREGKFYHNTGEGSISDFHLLGADIVYQLGTGYFGSRDEQGNFSSEKFKVQANRPEVKMIEIKLSQGAKPGHGGVLPAAKNNEEIARIRGVKPHTTIVSPSHHTAFSDAKGLLQFVQQLRDLSFGKPIGFKLCVGNKAEFEEICQQMIETGIKPDFITVDGAEGGTGAAPIEFSDHVGMPWENGLIFVSDTLRKYHLKDEIRIITSTKVVTGYDILKAICMGADLCNAARGMMISIGCIQALKCHTNKCPTGIATNRPGKVRGLVVEDKWRRVKNYHDAAIHDFNELFAATGCPDIASLNRSYIYKQVNNKEISFEELYPTVSMN